MATPLPGAAQGGQVNVITVEGVIDPFVARFVRQAVALSEAEGAECLVIELDTPGGTMEAMRDIVQSIMNSRVPVVVYVSPQGARAASAGLFITMAAHVAAMAPGTNIGAAHPVGLTGPITSTMGVKLTQDAAAYIRAIAEERGRNAGWAEKAVRESVSVTASEALDIGVVDLIAPDLDELLKLLDGREVKVRGESKALRTASVPIRRLRMGLADEILHNLVNPDIAYILLLLGILGLILELYHPGTMLPGVTGLICLILAFVALGNLPVNWGGVALIVLAIILFALDIKVAGFALSIGGGIAFILGSLLLFSPWPSISPVSPTMPRAQVSPWLIALMTALFGGFFLFVVSAVWRAQRAKALLGLDTIVGATGYAASDLDPIGTVLVQSEDWTAEAVEPPIRKGEKIVVVGREGIRLKVKRAQFKPQS